MCVVYVTLPFVRTLTALYRPLMFPQPLTLDPSLGSVGAVSRGSNICEGTTLTLLLWKEFGSAPLPVRKGGIVYAFRVLYYTLINQIFWGVSHVLPSNYVHMVKSSK